MKTSRCGYQTSLASFISALLLAVSADATTLTVMSTADAGGTCPGASCTLRQAIVTAAPNDTISFSLPANSTITLTSGQLLINKNLTISGPGANLLTVQRSAAAGNFRIFSISPASVNATISGLTIANGAVSGSVGGGIYNAGTLTLTSSTISGNTATNGGIVGGGIFNDGGTVTITNSTISGNSANGGGNGGGIVNNGGTVTITNSTISGNSASNGGGLHNTGTLSITDSTLSGNSASDSFGGGGGISNTNNGGLTITNSTVSGNNSVGDAGGISNLSGTLTIKKSTISGNSASGFGGGINNAGQCTITSSTISLNMASFGGGIYFGGGMVTAKNTIIALNAGGGAPDFSGTLTSEGYNLIGNTSGMAITGTTTGNQLNVNPMIGPLQNNGGPTFTHALLSGSTAIEGGQSFGSNNDQRRFARPVDSPAIPNASGGDGSDIGAYEVQADQLPGCSNINRIVNNNNDGATGSLRFVIAEVCAGSTITFAPNVTGAINLTNGELLINKTVTINGPGANLLSIQRSPAAGNFRIIDISPGTVIATISGLTIANGNTTTGGGILNDGTLTLTNATISGNFANTNIGGGIHNGNGTVTLTDSTISGNFANSDGGGISNSSGTVTLTNSTISDNSAYNGGGISNSGTLTITNSTISGNSAVDFGGGIYHTSGTATLTNSTISGNTVEFVGGGGIYRASGTVNARNTIIALNTAPAGPDFSGLLTSQNFNLIGNSSGATITPAQFSDQIGTPGSPINPLLGPLQNNGGPTLTRALLPGSPAIDKGHYSGSATDQRGFPRPVDNPALPNAMDGDGGDIGAFEVSVNISGAISYCSNPVPGPVPNVTLTLTGTTSGSTLSDGSGNYSLLGVVSGGNYTVTPTKAARVPGSANINTQDVIATQRHFLNLGTPLTGCKLLAADVTGDTLVNTSDVIAIQRFFLGLTTGIANTGKYKFTPVSRTYTGLVTNQTAQNYDTLVFGDTASSFVELVDNPEPTEVDDGTSISALSGLNAGAGEVAGPVAAVALPNVAVDAFVTDFIIPVTTTTINAGDKLVGFQGDFSFDERVVILQSEPVQKAGLTGGNWNVSGNVLLGTGPIRTLRISAYSNDFMALSGSGTLFELRMTRVSTAARGTQLIWAAPPDQFIFIDADLRTQAPGNAPPGSVTPSGKRK